MFREVFAKKILLSVVVVMAMALILSSIFGEKYEYVLVIGALMVTVHHNLISYWKMEWDRDMPNYHQWFWETRSLAIKVTYAGSNFVFLAYVYGVVSNVFWDRLSMSTMDVIFFGIPCIGFGIGFFLQPRLLYNSLKNSGWFCAPGNVYGVVKLNKDRDRHSNSYWYNFDKMFKEYNKMEFKIIRMSNGYLEVDTSHMFHEAESSYIRYSDCTIECKIKK